MFFNDGLKESVGHLKILLKVEDDSQKDGTISRLEKAKTKLEETAHKTPPKEYREEGATERSDYADPENYKYPLHKEENVRAALSYFAQPGNYGMYSPEKRKAIARRILSEAKKYKIEVSDDWKEKFGLKEKNLSKAINIHGIEI